MLKKTNIQRSLGELKAQNIFDSVVIASESDFGRTLSTNGAGTDHAWAGNYFVLGGKVIADPEVSAPEP